MQIVRVLEIMRLHVSNMSMVLITTFVIVIISTVMARPSISTNKSPSLDLDPSFRVKSKSFLPKLYGDYGFWNPSPVYGGGFPYPGPVPHGSLGPIQRHKKPKWNRKICWIGCSSTLLLTGKTFDIWVLYK